MRKRGKKIESVHDLECAMSAVLSEIATYDVVNGYGHVPSWLFSDFALDCDNIRNNPRKPFLWHTHDAGTYLHFVDTGDVDIRDFDGWRQDFLQWKDWTFTELNYKWGYDLHKHPMERIFYYDGEYFREVSRETALLIWRYTGLEIIHSHENKLIEDVVA